VPGPDSRAAKLRSGRDSPIARKFRAERGLSQEELAIECGLHRTYVRGVERGVRNPTVVVLEKIAKALKVAASRLLE
jgi:transcriptional regulator with XRE-family HTH domain